jgi:hypothetical protein
MSYELVFYDDQSGREPVREWLDALDVVKRAAAMRALSIILAEEGPGVCRTEYGRNLGGGLCEFRLRHDADEVLRSRRPDLHTKLPPQPQGQVLLRVFFAEIGGRVILLVGGYDKGRSPSKARQNAEIRSARGRLAEYQRRSAGSRPRPRFMGWWAQQVRRGRR